MNAKEVKGSISVIECGALPNGVHYLKVSCQNSDTYLNLPAALECNDVVYGRTGWDSDKCLAFYRTDAIFAVSK